MIVWTPAVLSILYACVLYFCICSCSAQLSMFHVERRSRNTLIVIKFIIRGTVKKLLFPLVLDRSMDAVKSETTQKPTEGF